MCGKPGQDRQGSDEHLRFHRTTEDLAILDAHHITDRNDMPNGGYVPENGISVCEACHELAEYFHELGEAYPGYAPEDLYATIGSSLEQARQASLKLSA